MVKLLRLTSNKDDNYNNAEEGLVFSVNMDDDLVVSPNAQIALKNLTFESDFTTFTTDATNGLLSVRFETVRGVNSFPLTPAVYTKTTVNDFFKDFRITLNRCLNTLTNQSASPATSATQDFYGQFFIDPASQFKDIEFRLTPALNPIINRPFSLPGVDGWGVNKNLFSIGAITDPTTVGVEVDYDKITAVGDLTPPDMCLMNGIAIRTDDNRDQYIAPTTPAIRWCQGNAVWSARIDTLRDNGSGKRQNGFEIGLASAIPFGQADENIKDADVKFALRAYKNTDDVAHIVPNADFTSNPVYVDNTGILPTNPQPTERAKSDTFVISCIQPQNGSGAKKVIGQLFKEDTAVAELFSYDIPEGSEEETLFPYIAFFDSNVAGGAKAHSPVVTFDPFHIDNYTDNSYITRLQPSQKNNFAGQNVFDLTTGGDQTVFDYTATGNAGLPILNNDWFGGNLGLEQSGFLQTHTDVLNFVGFSNNQLKDVGGGESRIEKPLWILGTASYPFGIKLIPANVFVLASSDNYVVVLDSQKLISYECSKPATSSQSRSIDVVGKRANILATIPVNNSSGIVEFSANEVLYIDFDNKGETAIRNLRLRVLDKSLQPILVEGMSVMTLLIKDE